MTTSIIHRPKVIDIHGDQAEITTVLAGAAEFAVDLNVESVSSERTCKNIDRRNLAKFNFADNNASQVAWCVSLVDRHVTRLLVDCTEGPDFAAIVHPQRHANVKTNMWRSQHQRIVAEQRMLQVLDGMRTK